MFHVKLCSINFLINYYLYMFNDFYSGLKKECFTWNIERNYLFNFNYKILAFNL